VFPGSNSSPALFTVTNGSCATTGPLSVSLSGQGATQFEIETPTDTCTAVVLEPTTSCTLDIRFSPAQGGSASATLNVNSAPGGSASAALTGNGYDNCPFNMAPTSNDFGSIPLGQESNPFTFTVTNVSVCTTGTILTQIFGPNPAFFHVSSDNCASNTLPPNGSCSLQVAFSPTVLGLQTADLDVSDIRSHWTSVAQLSGTGTSPPDGGIDGGLATDGGGDAGQPDG
jgi:trimeric autotransporter adhesin